MAVEHIKKWRIGDVEVVRIVEINAFEDDMSMLLADGSPELVKSYPWLIPKFATPAGRMLISFQCFVLRSRDKRVMIDTCIGADRQREYEVFCNLKTTFLEDLAAAGYAAPTINTVMCTHLHFDHVGWNTQKVDGKWVPTFPNARYLFGRTEWDHWVHLRETNGYHHMDHLVDSIDPVVEAGLMDLVEAGHRITDEVWLEPTPGHTPGHASVRLTTAAGSAIFSGDLMHRVVQVAEPQWSSRFCYDGPAAAKTRRAFIEQQADTGTLICAAHFPTPGYIVRADGGYRFEAAR
jgi:glyoxylase-like metal-dependent hydrolase (beta-lactamase superfamily II)